jgi:hypothetical protein
VRERTKEIDTFCAELVSRIRLSLIDLKFLLDLAYLDDK